MTTFRATDLPDLTGRTAIVTGSNSGVGLHTAHALSAAGARVVYAVRDVDKGREAAASALGRTEVRELDLANLDSVRRFARDWDDEISLLICNAGVVMPPSITRTADGFETQFGVNHLGHFALTNLLLEHVTGRVVSVFANAYRFGKIDFDDLNWERKRYRSSAAYGQSKLANVLFIAELQRRLTAAGSSVLATAAHPGAARTDAFTKAGRSSGALTRLFMRLFAQSPADAALEPLYAAVADVPGGGLVGPGGFMQTSGAPKLVQPSKAVGDLELARRLWDVSAEMTHVQPALALG